MKMKLMTKRNGGHDVEEDEEQEEEEEKEEQLNINYYL